MSVTPLTDMVDEILDTYMQLIDHVCSDDMCPHVGNCDLCGFKDAPGKADPFVKVIRHLKYGKSEQTTRDELYEFAEMFRRMMNYTCVYCKYGDSHCPECGLYNGVEHWATINALAMPGAAWLKNDRE